MEALPVIANTPVAPVAESTSMGMAVLGQTSLSLVVVVGMILGCYWVIKRCTNGAGISRKHLKIVSSSMVGTKERVVIVEVKNTWLVLGVGNGTVNKLHELPKPEDSGQELEQAQLPRFADRLKEMMRPQSRP
ncbi:flagellar biosynthetic protein FliO [Pseudomonas serbica]|jgi:flagellar protein FliO/FliZ|uniref:flagellar biosynthetic protein FliO n=1 Tax=Pseudomonas serbica TaxID=2965074 RepID=UPI00237AF718|nr:flagellar biosynthetic protein FliO [Pseudomonas serbica]